MWGRSWKNKKVTKENHLTQKFKSELRFYLQSVVAHVDNVTEETTIDVLDDGAGADLKMIMIIVMMMTMVTQHIPTMTKSHHGVRNDEGGNVSVSKTHYTPYTMMNYILEYICIR